MAYKESGECEAQFLNLWHENEFFRWFMGINLSIEHIPLSAELIKALHQGKPAGPIWMGWERPVRNDHDPPRKQWDLHIQKSDPIGDHPVGFLNKHMRCKPHIFVRLQPSIGLEVVGTGEIKHKTIPSIIILYGIT